MHICFISLKSYGILNYYIHRYCVEQEFNTEEKYLTKFRTKILGNSIFICCKRLNTQKDKNYFLSV